MPFGPSLPPSLHNSRKQERETARRTGGRLVKQSGAGPEKGDVRAPGLSIECKTTVRASYGLKLEDLEKNLTTAAQRGDRAVFLVRFLSPQGSTIREFAVVESDVLEQLT